MCLVADDEQQRHAVDDDREEAELFECGSVVNDFAQRAIRCDDGREEYDETVDAVHVGIGAAQLLHHVAQVHPQISELGQLLCWPRRLNHLFQFGDERGAGGAEGGAIEEPKAAEAVQHRQNVVIGERVPEQKVRLKVVLYDHEQDGCQPRDDAQRPRDHRQALENDRRAGHFQELQLVIGPHVLEFGHLVSVAPGGQGQQEMRQQEAHEDDVVDDFVETLRGRQKAEDTILEDDDDDHGEGAVDEVGPHERSRAPVERRAWHI